MALIIRAAKNGDAEDIVELIKDWASASGDYSPVTILYVEMYLNSPSDHILIAEWNHQFAGLLAYSLRSDLWHAAPCCQIEDVVVNPMFRGKGIGTELLKFIVERAKQERYAEISLTVGKDNLKAQELYKRLGFDEEAICLEKHIK
jgi:ribosomal protein S18 acetylase RimI-like enzyme